MLLVDTNILLRLADPASTHHPVCVEAMRRLLAAGEELVICAQVLIEFRAVATRPRSANGLEMSSTQARGALDSIRLAHACLTEPPDIADRWMALADRYSVEGKSCHDARLVALMLAHNVDRILTINGVDFARFREVRVLSPDQVLATYP
jgi:predicted nucleic acid-binding protein